MTPEPAHCRSSGGFVAGPKQSDENPLGEGGERLHDWVVPLAAWREPHGKKGGEVNESTRVMQEAAENIGAGVMGRNMFGPPPAATGATRSGGTTRRTTTTSSSSPITRAIRSRWKERPRFTSSPTASRGRSNGRGRPRAAT